MSVPDDLEPISPATDAAHERETDALIRAQLPLAAGLCAGMFGLSRLLEFFVQPSHAPGLSVSFALHLLLGVGAAAWALSAPHRLRGGALCLGLGTMLLNNAYLGWSHANAERLAIADVCLLTAASVLMPLGWRRQLVFTAATLVTLLLVSPWLQRSEFRAMPLLGVIVGGSAAVWSAMLMERYRRAGLQQTLRAREEADTAATLARIAETLNQYVSRPDMLEHVGQLGAETLGCDWCSIFLREEDTGLFRFRSGHGVPPEWRAVLDSQAFGIERLGLAPDLLRGKLVEIADVAQARGAAHDRGDLPAGATLYAPILLDGRLVGGISFNWRAPRIAFDDRIRRLAVGIAHAATVGLQNTRVLEHLQAANKLKSDFVAMVSHELRTPLNVIMGYSELLGDEDFGPLTAAQRDALDKTRRSAVELLDLITATLDASRLEAGRMVVELDAVELGAMLAGLTEELTPLVPGGVRLVVEPIAGRTTVVTDRVKVKTILKNLVGNALKFTDRGSVTVYTGVQDGRLRLTVADTGIGIDPAQLPIIFEMFRQGDGTSTRRHGGVGLGLNIVQRYVQLLGGTLDVDSTPGAGSTFRVDLPVEAAAGAAVA